MPGQPVTPKGSPPPLAPYSPGMRSGNLRCTSGMAGAPEGAADGAVRDEGP